MPPGEGWFRTPARGAPAADSIVPASVARVVCAGGIARLSPPDRHLFARSALASLKLLGGVSIETQEGPLAGRAAQRRRLALLALLAASGGMGREKLIAYLWPDADSERGRHLLSDSVYRINQALGGEAVLAAGDELRLRPELLAADVAEFEALVDEGKHGDAVALYRGPFLDGFFLDGAPEFERWAERERERLSRLYAAGLESLAEGSEREGDLRRAAEWWYRLAAHDPFSPRVALRLMRALDAAGERAAALQHARVHEALFRQEFGAEPGPEVAALAERLRSEAPPATHVRREEPLRADPGSVPGDAGEPRGAEEGHPDGSAPPGPAVPSRAGGFAVLLLLLLAGAGSVWYLRGPSGSPPAVPAVAVLPFADHSPGRDHAYFASGITEEVAGNLARVGGLRVVAHTPPLPAAGADVQEIGERLGVGAVLHGSVSRWGDSVRINARLIRVADRAYLWSERYTSRLGSVFAIQDSISRAIAATLTEQLVGRGHAPPAELSAEEMEAYNLYLKGRYAWHRRTRESLAGAVSYFERSVAGAPGYARGHAGLADAYAVQGFYDHRPPADAFPKAEAAARRALALDGSLAHPYATLGYVNLYFHWRWPDAENAFRRSIELDPSYSTAHQWYANHLTAMGRFDEAEQAMRRAMELDPLSLIANAALGWVYYHAGDYASAIEQFDRTLELDPTFGLAYLWKGLAHEQLGRSDEAIRLLEKSLALSPGSVVVVAALAHANATAGRRERATELLRGLLAADERYVPAFEVAKVHLGLGETDAALDWLEKAYEQRSHSMAFLKVDPQLAPLRTHPRFRELLRRVGHPL